jgi:hypothetical protein
MDSWTGLSPGRFSLGCTMAFTNLRCRLLARKRNRRNTVLRSGIGNFTNLCHETIAMPGHSFDVLHPVFAVPAAPYAGSRHAGPGSTFRRNCRAKLSAVAHLFQAGAHDSQPYGLSWDLGSGRSRAVAEWGWVRFTTIWSGRRAKREPAPSSSSGFANQAQEFGIIMQAGEVRIARYPLEIAVPGLSSTSQQR